jgi:hypothetical protein
MTSGAKRLRMSVRRGWTRLPRHSSWFPGTEVEGARDGSWCCRAWRCFTWLLSLPTWGWCGRARLPPAPSYGLHPSEGWIMLPDRCCPVPSLSSGRWPLFGGAKLQGLDIWSGVDCPGTCETKLYIEKLAFIRACLSDVRDIMVIMRVALVELLCQMVMGWILLTHESDRSQNSLVKSVETRLSSLTNRMVWFYRFQQQLGVPSALDEGASPPAKRCLDGR